MKELERDIAVLELENQQLEDVIALLKRDNASLQRDKKALKTFVKKNRIQIYEYVRQGFRYEYNRHNSDWGRHYLVIPVEGIPLSLQIADVKQLIEEALNPYLKKEEIYDGYKIMHFDYSARKKVWYAQIEKLLDTTERSNSVE